MPRYFFSSNANKPRICILGGGFGGLYTALALRRYYRHFQGWDVALVNGSQRFVFTPLLYELVTGEMELWEIAPPYRELLRNTPVTFYCNWVESIDLEARQLRLQDRSLIDYDYLVLALGKTGARLPHESVLSFRNLADAQALDERLQQLESRDVDARIRVGVVGGGPNGVELAGKIADRLGKRGEVRLIDRGDRLLPHFTRATQTSASKALDRRGIRVSLQSQVTGVTEDCLEFVQHGERVEVPIDLVVWTAGTQNREIVANLDCLHTASGKLVVEPTLQLHDRPEVFVLGDIASIRDNGVPETAQVTYQQAGYAAYNIWASSTHHPLKSFQYLHLGEMVTLGVNDGVTHSFGIHLNGALGNFVRRLVYTQRLPTNTHSLRVFWHWLKRSIVSGLKKLLLGKKKRDRQQKKACKRQFINSL
ncbi:MAG: FAD-dependent oxidoreductase [Cyanobacteria bacterium SBC]|nr:FAD-dependent oxidoreductase [Cyanobacteria bacterium SBC]